jgi:fatty-acyl-CoA synthase
MPKRIKVINPMPLTGVGKIFKPALRYDAIKEAFEAELKNIGDLAESVEVVVKEDKVHGTLALITVKPAKDVSEQTIRARIDSLLGQYTVRYECGVVP